MLAFLGLLSVFAFLSFLALLGLFGFFGFLTCTVADLSCNKESEKKCVEQKTNASKKHRLSQRPKRKERQRSRNEPKAVRSAAGDVGLALVSVDLAEGTVLGGVRIGAPAQMPAR